MERRKKLAKQQREMEAKQEEMTPEEIEAMEASVPEWKRGALVVTDEGQQEEKKGIFGRIKSKVSGKISSTEAAKKFYESEDYEKI